MTWFFILVPVFFGVFVLWEIIEAFRDTQRSRKYIDEIVGKRDIRKIDEGFEEHLRKRTDDSQSR